MRVLALIALLLAAPLASATHPVERDLSGEVDDGATIVLALQASGSIRSSGSGTEKRGSSQTDVTHAYSFTYSWGGTVQLDLRADGFLSGDAQLSGGGTGRLNDHSRITVFDDKGAVTNTIDANRDCDVDQRLFNDGKLHARGRVDAEKGELLVVIQSAGDRDGERECTFTSEGSSEESDLFPPPPLSPLLVEGITAIARSDKDVKGVAPTLDEINAANAIVFRVPLQNGHVILRGGASAALPVTYGSAPLGYACPPPMDSQVVKGTCSAAGTLDVRVLVDPCPVLRESRTVHLAAVKALVRPANGSSESQVRAFSVDARQKVTALLADERALQLVCGDESPDALVVVAEAAQKVVDAWADVARTHGLSDQGKRDLVAAERANQLAGGESGAATSATVGEVLFSPGSYGRVRIDVHSPVALHAWDEEGRHVGWNETTDAPESQIEGANYTGEPGGGQTLDLPSGLYKIAVVELEAGSYLLGAGWNGTAGEGGELLPAASVAGRTLVFNALLDEHGYLAGPAQRIATTDEETFAFVEAWRPLDAGPAALGSADRGASRDEEDRGGAGADTRGAPLGGAAWVALAAVAAALLVRRRA